MIKGPKMVYRQGSKLLGVTKITDDRGLNRETQRSQRTRVFGADMEFVQIFTPPDFWAKNFTLSISPNFNSFSGKTQTMSENGEIYTAGKNFTLPPALTAWTNSTSA